jgi:hypothetical protein
MDARLTVRQSELISSGRRSPQFDLAEWLPSLAAEDGQASYLEEEGIAPLAATVEREKGWICRSFSEPSDGLEPSTPSLP